MKGHTVSSPDSSSSLVRQQKCPSCCLVCFAVTPTSSAPSHSSQTQTNKPCQAPSVAKQPRQASLEISGVALGLQDPWLCRGLAMSCLQRSVTEGPDSSAALPKNTLSWRHNKSRLSGPRTSTTPRPLLDDQKELPNKEEANKRPMLNQAFNSTLGHKGKVI